MTAPQHLLGRFCDRDIFYRPGDEKAEREKTQETETQRLPGGNRNGFVRAHGVVLHQNLLQICTVRYMYSTISWDSSATGFTLAQGVVIMAFQYIHTHLAVPKLRRTIIGRMFKWISSFRQRSDGRWINSYSSSSSISGQLLPKGASVSPIALPGSGSR